MAHDEQDTSGAYHEAGHAALTLYYGGEVEKVTASETRSRCAGVFIDGRVTYYESLERVHENIRILNAGYVAVARSDDELDERTASIMTGSEDMRRVSDLAKRFQIPHDVIAQLEMETTALVKDLWVQVKHIASVILEQGSMDQADLQPSKHTLTTLRYAAAADHLVE